MIWTQIDVVIKSGWDLGGEVDEDAHAKAKMTAEQKLIALGSDVAEQLAQKEQMLGTCVKQEKEHSLRSSMQPKRLQIMSMRKIQEDAKTTEGFYL